ncbi:MAG TPA: cell division protein ZapE [Deinococcales bacterium]|nr:cell division protein ZapE [Deinococcales bacterium]
MPRVIPGGSSPAAGEPPAAGRVVDLLRRDAPVDPEALLAGFVPPPRFRLSTFESFRPNPGFPSQAEAVSRLQALVAAPAARGWRWFRRQPEPPRGLYLDGGFGVGKTHLLAATFHAARGERAFRSFQELVYTIGALGMARALEAMRPLRLLAVDEFELDDPGNTLIVATFLAGLTPGGTTVVTTSNTLPGQLGEGRFNADDFRREIAALASHFDTLSIDGPDYRHREGLSLPAPVPEPVLRSAFTAEGGVKAWVSFDDLNAHLARLHPVRYAGLLQGLDALFVSGLRPILSQDVALRFVHFLDKVYDSNVRLLASGEALGTLFPPGYRHGGYAKKYSRCLSRLGELLREATPD